MLVLDNSTIKAVIDEYAKSEIQSEAEVRSKLVVPLLCALGYPSELRAEEFPVYGFGGRKKLPAKSADFLLFSDKEFGAHRNDTQKDKDWVQSHSLLIVEAKKPGEMPILQDRHSFILCGQKLLPTWLQMDVKFRRTVIAIYPLIIESFAVLPTNCHILRISVCSLSIMSELLKRKNK